MTPVFGGLAIALAVVALATTQLMLTQDRASRRDWERLQRTYAAEGVATIAAWRVMHEAGTPTLRWTEPSNQGPMAVVVEPEMRKLSLAEVGGSRGQARLAQLLGSSAVSAVSGRLVALASSGNEIATREEILRADGSAAWSQCGLSLVSAFSRLTDNALATPKPPTSAAYADRAGEVWRIVVRADGRALTDRLVRFTGDVKTPVAVIDEAEPGVRADVGDCVSRIGVPEETDP